jgi:hypothetical protein
MKAALDGKGLLGTAQYLRCRGVVDDITLENLIKQIGMFNIRYQMDLGTYVLLLFFDPHFTNR